MKRRKAIILFGSFFLMLLAYVTWCARPFYLKPPLPSEPELPDQARARAEQWRKSTSLLRPLEFNWNDFLCTLAEPWGEFRNPIIVWIDGHPTATQTMNITYKGHHWTSFYSYRDSDWGPVGPGRLPTY
jgi:hypothetical protein